ncbi:MAG TPA: hypothetical protein VIW45_19465 [Vicinamibacterales bacterium]|jgi:uncharacterized membrane protein
MPDAPPHRGVMIVLAYLWPLAIVPLLVERNDSEVRWHARNGVRLMLCELVIAAAYLAAASVFHAAAIGLGGALLVCIVAVWALTLAVHIAAIVKGINGERLIVPWISERAR